MGVWEYIRSYTHMAGRVCLSRCWERFKVDAAVAHAGKTTCIVYGMYEEYMAARSKSRLEPYRGVFVTASPTLKEQVQAAFSKLQVGAASGWCQHQRESRTSLLWAPAVASP